MWTCPECARTFAIRHQWHSCIDLTLKTRLMAASDQAVGLYRAFEAAVSECGEFRIHPQKTRIAFISTMTFAGARLGRRWIDLSLITPEPIDDPRIRTLACYGPTSFAHGMRISKPEELDDEVHVWLCVAKERGDQRTLDPHAQVTPLHGRPLELVSVPFRSEVLRRPDVGVRIPRYAAQVFGANPAVLVRLAGVELTGVILSSDRGYRLSLDAQLGLDDGEKVDVVLRADPRSEHSFRRRRLDGGLGRS